LRNSEREGNRPKPALQSFIGPTFNAASWQSIPAINDEGGLAMKQLPSGASPDGAGEPLPLRPIEVG
jgi:hypothetical protein